MIFPQKFGSYCVHKLFGSFVISSFTTLVISSYCAIVHQSRVLPTCCPAVKNPILFPIVGASFLLIAFLDSKFTRSETENKAPLFVDWLIDHFYWSHLGDWYCVVPNCKPPKMEKSEKNAKNVIGIRCAGEEGFDWMGLAVNRQRLPFT